MTPSTCSGIGSSASTASTSRPLAASSAADANVARVGPVGLALGAPLLARVDERDHLDVGVVEVRAHVEVVDAAEADERGAHRSVVRREAHCVRVSCWSSMVLPAGSVIQICTTPSPCTPRTYSMPRASSSAIGGVEVVDRDAVVVAGRVDAGAPRRCADEVQLLSRRRVPVARRCRGCRAAARRRGRARRGRSRPCRRPAAPLAVHRHVVEPGHLHSAVCLRGSSCSMNSSRMPPGASTNAMRRVPNVPSTTAGPHTTCGPRARRRGRR